MVINQPSKAAAFGYLDTNMRKIHILIRSGAAGLAILCASCSSTRPQWEYTVVGTAAPNKEQVFNQLGKEGWQLVQSDPLKGYLFRREKP